MTTAHTGDGVLPPELEAIAAAAHDRLHAQAGQDLSAEQDAQRRVAEAAGAAITAGAALGAIAEAERTGELRARQARVLVVGSGERADVWLPAGVAVRSRSSNRGSSRPGASERRSRRITSR